MSGVRGAVVPAVVNVKVPLASLGVVVFVLAGRVLVCERWWPGAVFCAVVLFYLGCGGNTGGYWKPIGWLVDWWALCEPTGLSKITCLWSQGRLSCERNEKNVRGEEEGKEEQGHHALTQTVICVSTTQCSVLCREERVCHFQN